MRDSGPPRPPWAFRAVLNVEVPTGSVTLVESTWARDDAGDVFAQHIEGWVFREKGEIRGEIKTMSMLPVGSLADAVCDRARNCLLVRAMERGSSRAIMGQAVRQVTESAAVDVPDGLEVDGQWMPGVVVTVDGLTVRGVDDFGTRVLVSYETDELSAPPSIWTGDFAG
jgi:hypothetical protein